MLKDGAIIDTSIVKGPRQCNIREEYKQVREDIIPEEWMRMKKEEIFVMY